jgi:dsRNA-specific ribonuclease
MRTIEFRTIAIEETIRTLADFFSAPSNDPIPQKKREKFSRWAEDLEKILEQISLFKKHAVPLITSDLEYTFGNRNLVLTAMMQYGMRNVFSEIKTQFGNDPEHPVSPDDLDWLIAAPDTAGSLAWLGDSAIRFAVSLYVWEPKLTKEQLHNKREALVTDRNLSDLCNHWQLYRYRFYQDSVQPEEKRLEEIKGTFTEAIFGVIFVEKGIEGVLKALPLIDTKK